MRRRHQEVVRVVEQKCPTCSHPPKDHNQFGCCFQEAVCPCLKTGADLEVPVEADA